MTGCSKIAAELGDRRRQKRSKAVASVGFRQRGKTRISSKLLDLTTSGCKIKLAENIHAGERVWVTLPTLESWYAKVAWVADGYAGLDFEQPLHPAVADLVVRRAAVWTFTSAVSSPASS